ncbi:MAG: hypothetical protein L6R40_004260 [Gallowayella cf. fulva]|nr:MAG: hypothetical protein L6R40_004260 [Xanthomendoza cf. fulva]
MPFRVLCLHGMGVNAAIFAAQTAHFRSLLPLDYEWIFIDGPAECDAAPGVAAFYEPPYLCWYTSPTTAKMDSAHKLISSVIERDGPFDAVMGFSQGAALAASAILRHQIQHPNRPPLFNMGIFICSPMPFSQSLDFGVDARKYFGLGGLLRPSRPGCPTTVPEYLITDPAYLKGEDELDDSSSGSDDESLPVRRTSPSIFYQMYHSTVDTVRIKIPTVHVYGRRDKWRLHSKDLVKLCPKNLATVYEHDGGHEIPKSASEEICDAIEIAVASL